MTRRTDPAARLANSTRICLWCGEALPDKRKANRMYCGPGSRCRDAARKARMDPVEDFDWRAAPLASLTDVHPRDWPEAAVAICG